MTPAEELRAAAAAIHHVLDRPRLTPGPWQSLDGGDRLVRIPIPEDASGTDYVVDEPIENAANAEYIAAMHPGVGAALADWLDVEVAYLGDVEEQAQAGLAECLAHVHGALAVARAILGTNQ